MRLLPFIVAALGLTACSPPVPDSAAGVGFGDYNSYFRGAQPAPVAPAAPILPPAQAPAGFSPQGAAAAIDRATGVAPAAPVVTQPAATPPIGAVIAGNAPATRPRGNAPAGIKEESGELLPANAGVSDEQDFAAVAARETIQSDKERIERNKSQYQVDQPTAVPTRAGDVGGAGIVQFALSTSHPVGTQMYKRGSLRLKNTDAACLKYGSPDMAQEDFLNSGGPERDRKGLDADGDGYACGWNPAPFRAALQ